MTEITTLKRVKFVGDFAMLKRIGFTFQRLYADNRLAWHRNNTFVFKRGGIFKFGNYSSSCLTYFVEKMLSGVEFDDLKVVYNLQTLNPQLFNSEYVECYQNNDTQEIHGNRDVFKSWRRGSFAAFNNNDDSFDHGLWSAIAICRESWDELKTMVDLGWLIIDED